ncbi:uncharacterized protein CLUP02_08597 [Colletotrichum lupini]|uniref:Uncharacterized protein n=1 Tax=Colletotrichum lupini TaxID=145971 RepID=A0A9Q8ST66_9PEZI|nr:uncharacterized protein CLUP02_08597 [Colletotrichum lupini]UQC83104.1 hypothetical protein CLUP02_08597 [Colletotrichum lupini]
MGFPARSVISLRLQFKGQSTVDGAMIQESVAYTIPPHGQKPVRPFESHLGGTPPKATSPRAKEARERSKSRHRCTSRAGRRSLTMRTMVMAWQRQHSVLAVFDFQNPAAVPAHANWNPMETEEPHIGDLVQGPAPLTGGLTSKGQLGVSSYNALRAAIGSEMGG